MLKKNLFGMEKTTCLRTKLEKQMAESAFKCWTPD